MRDLERRLIYDQNIEFSYTMPMNAVPKALIFCFIAVITLPAVAESDPWSGWAPPETFDSSALRDETEQLLNELDNSFIDRSINKERVVPESRNLQLELWRLENGHDYSLSKMSDQERAAYRAWLMASFESVQNSNFTNEDRLSDFNSPDFNSPDFDRPNPSLNEPAWPDHEFEPPEGWEEHRLNFEQDFNSTFEEWKKEQELQWELNRFDQNQQHP